MPDVILDVSEQDWNEAGSKYVTIPPGASGQEAEGDNITLLCESSLPEWKTPGKSLKWGFTVTEKGINEGKYAEMYPAVTKDGLFKTKQIAEALGASGLVEFKGGRVVLHLDLAAGKVARVKFSRELSNRGNFRSIPTEVYPATASETVVTPI